MAARGINLRRVLMPRMAGVATALMLTVSATGFGPLFLVDQLAVPAVQSDQVVHFDRR